MLQQLSVSSTSKTELSMCFVKRRVASVVQTVPRFGWESGVPRFCIGWRNSVSMAVNFGAVSVVRSLILKDLVERPWTIPESDSPLNESRRFAIGQPQYLTEIGRASCRK